MPYHHHLMISNNSSLCKPAMTKSRCFRMTLDVRERHLLYIPMGNRPGRRNCRFCADSQFLNRIGLFCENNSEYSICQRYSKCCLPIISILVTIAGITRRSSFVLLEATILLLLFNKEEHIFWENLGMSNPLLRLSSSTIIIGLLTTFLRTFNCIQCIIHETILLLHKSVLSIMRFHDFGLICMCRLIQCHKMNITACNICF